MAAVIKIVSIVTASEPPADTLIEEFLATESSEIVVHFGSGHSGRIRPTGDPEGVLVHADASAFYRSITDAVQLDPTYIEIDRVLTTDPNMLRLRSASSVGRLRYDDCSLDRVSLSTAKSGSELG